MMLFADVIVVLSHTEASSERFFEAWYICMYSFREWRQQSSKQ